MPKPRKRRVPKRHKKGPDDFDYPLARLTKGQPLPLS